MQRLVGIGMFRAALLWAACVAAGMADAGEEPGMALYGGDGLAAPLPPPVTVRVDGEDVPVIDAETDGALLGHRLQDGSVEPLTLTGNAPPYTMYYLKKDQNLVPVAEYDPDNTYLDNRRKQMGWWYIAFLAITDGVNPCAFASIIMLVSMMATARRTRRETVVIGVCFTAAVFIAYFAIGWGFHAILRGLAGYYMVSDVIYYAAFLLCVVCGALSLWDAYVVWRRRDAGAMTLQLSKNFKKRIQKALSTGVRSSRLAAGTFVAGLFVSMFEAACTGQVFFPFIAQLREASLSEAVVRLTWYCLVFVLPLIAVFALALAGVTNVQLADWMKRHIVATKLALAAVFLTMAALLFGDLKFPPGYRSSMDITPGTVNVNDARQGVMRSGNRTVGVYWNGQRPAFFDQGPADAVEWPVDKPGDIPIMK